MSEGGPVEGSDEYGPYVLLPLAGSKGGYAKIDKEDWDRCSQYRWHPYLANNHTGPCYIVGRVRDDEGGWKKIALHRFIAQAGRGTIVDHAGGDTLDNRKSRLRFVDRFQSSHNRKPNGDRKFKGIWRVRGRHGDRWRARILVRGKLFNLGNHDTPEEAAAAYEKASLELQGDYAFAARRGIHKGVSTRGATDCTNLAR